ncbi:MAG: elongation factor G [Planctomycetota bacterium]|jgi:elongation factor G
MAYSTTDIRNISLVGHGGGGKTTLTERFLADTGVIGRMGTVEDGNTVSDFSDEEKHHTHSLSASLMNFDYEGRHFNVVDTPGMPDFLGQAIPCLPACETVCIVVDATKGIQTVTRRMMRIAAERKFPRLIVINKMDHVSAEELEELVGHLRETFGNECLCANLPTGGGAGVIDVINAGEGETDILSVADAHTQILDQVVEIDDDLMGEYLESGTVEKGKLHDAFEQALREGHLVPMLFASAKDGVGTKELLDFVAHWCPNPIEGNPRPFEATHGEGTPEEEWHATPDESEHAVAHVFKVSADPFVGKLAVFRVHQGSIKANSQIIRNDDKKPIRIGHIFKLQGKEHTDTERAIPGDIVAVAKVEEIKLNDVLHEPSDLHGLHLRPLPMPVPMLGVAIEPKARGDETKLGSAIHKLMDEDPTFVVERVNATRQTVARGLGDLHLRVMMERLKGRYGVEVTTAPQKVAYKETIAGKGEGHHRHKKQTGGAGQFGEVYLRVEPLPADHESGFEFVDDTFGGSVPKQFMPAIEKGIKAVLENGAVAGYPMIGVKVSVYDGKFHPVDSKEIAFITAGKKAFIEAVQKSKPTLLEPFVEMEVTAPASYMGDLTSDLIAKRGRINGSDILPGDMCCIHAVAPLAEVMSYTTQLKSITQGQGSFSLHFSHEEAAPANIVSDVAAQFEGHKDED